MLNKCSRIWFIAYRSEERVDTFSIGESDGISSEAAAPLRGDRKQLDHPRETTQPVFGSMNGPCPVKTAKRLSTITSIEQLPDTDCESGSSNLFGRSIQLRGGANLKSDAFPGAHIRQALPMPGFIDARSP
jgi:hypothetical protein